MACTQEFADYVIEQIDNAGIIAAKKMFGGYHVYSDGKLFAIIVNDKLFVKITESGREFIKDAIEVPAFPKAKVLSFLIEDKIEDREWISTLVRITIADLPETEPKKKKTKKQSKK